MQGVLVARDPTRGRRRDKHPEQRIARQVPDLRDCRALGGDARPSVAASAAMSLLPSMEWRGVIVRRIDGSARPSPIGTGPPRTGTPSAARPADVARRRTDAGTNSG